VKEHIDVYTLIANTSIVLGKNLRKQGKKSKYPKSVIDLTDALKDAHECEGTIKAMQKFIQIYDR